MSTPQFDRSDLLVALDTCWQFASGHTPDQVFNISAAANAIDAGQIRPDWNDGHIAPNDLLNAHAFGALISGEPSLWMQGNA